MSGTSMATPCAVGTAVLCLAKHKKQEAAGGPNDCQTQEQLGEHFKKYSIDKGTIGKDSTYGWGAVDVDDLIVQGEGSTPTPTPILTPAPATPNVLQRIWKFLFGWL
jgi:subtilisin family serine protease